MIDTHAHLSDPKFAKELNGVLQRARDNGVTTIICPSTSLRDMYQVAELVNTYAEVYGLAGLYPGEVENDVSLVSGMERINELVSKNPKILGIGEIGLDGESYRKNPEFEKKVFESQIKLALKLKLPIVIHTRETEEVMWRVMDKYPKLPSGQMHCFGGSQEFLTYVLKRGFYVGFDGNVTYKSANNLRELAKLVPKDRLLIETDSPYLPPMGKRGERNEPANVRITAEFLAKLRGESLEDLDRYTSNNARILFGL